MAKKDEIQTTTNKYVWATIGAVALAGLVTYFMFKKSCTTKSKFEKILITANINDEGKLATTSQYMEVMGYNVATTTTLPLTDETYQQYDVVIHIGGQCSNKEFCRLSGNADGQPDVCNCSQEQKLFKPITKKGLFIQTACLNNAKVISLGGCTNTDTLLSITKFTVMVDEEGLGIEGVYDYNELTAEDCF